MPRPPSKDKLGSVNNTNMAIFLRVGISPILMLKFKGWPDRRLIDYLNSTLNIISDEEREKVKLAIALITERSKKRAAREESLKTVVRRDKNAAT